MPTDWRRIFRGRSKEVDVTSSHVETEKVVHNISYEKFSEDLVKEVGRRVGIDFRLKIVRQLMRNWDIGSDPGIYDGFYVRDDGENKRLVVSPLGQLEKAGILSLEYDSGENRRVVWLHASNEVRKEMLGLSRGDRTFAFIGSVFPMDWYTFQPNMVNQWVEQLNVAAGCDRREFIHLRDLVFGWHKLGPVGNGLTSSIHRVDMDLLRSIDMSGVAIRQPEVSDIDMLGSMHDFLSSGIGVKIETANYSVPGRLITSYFKSGYENGATPDDNAAQAMVIAGLLGNLG